MLIITVIIFYIIFMSSQTSLFRLFLFTSISNLLLLYHCGKLVTFLKMKERLWCHLLLKEFLSAVHCCHSGMILMILLSCLDLIYLPIQFILSTSNMEKQINFTTASNNGHHRSSCIKGISSVLRFRDPPNTLHKPGSLN